MEWAEGYRHLQQQHGWLRLDGVADDVGVKEIVGKDAVHYHIDPSHSAEAVMRLFGSIKGTVFLVCDRYVACARMARELDGKVILCWCWIRQRRDFIECAAGQAKPRQWCEGWIERFALVCRLNKARLKHYDPALALERQTPAFDAARDELRRRSRSCSRRPKRN